MSETNEAMNMWSSLTSLFCKISWEWREIKFEKRKFLSDEILMGNFNAILFASQMALYPWSLSPMCMGLIEKLKTYIYLHSNFDRSQYSYVWSVIKWLTSRLPFGQYCVTMQMLGESTHAPINWTRLSCRRSLIWNTKSKPFTTFAL